MLQKLKSRNNKLTHLLLIAIGSIFLLSGSFQNSLWFDEAYTVGLMHNSFFDMLKWAAADVHPHLYYIMLWLFTKITGTGLIAMRIFSAIGAVLLGLLGFTHIKKDFGEKTGFWFSFVCYSFTGVFYYTIQIRMYTWAALFVTLAAIYAYRLTYKDNSSKNRILFIIFSVAAAYTHYFALFAVCAINVMLLVKLLREKSKLKDWIVNGIYQIILYIPGLLVFLHQISMSGGTWIRVEFPDSFMDLSVYHFTGELLRTFFADGSQNKLYPFVGLFCVTVYTAAVIYACRKVQKDNVEYKPLKLSLIAYYSVILFTLYVSFVRPLYYARYTIVIIGLLIFAVAFLIARLKNNRLKAVCAAVLIAVMALNARTSYMLVYDKSSDDVENTMQSLVEDKDVFLVDNFSEYVISIRFPNNQVCFYNKDKSGVWDAYRAFGKDSVIVGEMVDAGYADKTGRFWALNNGYWFDYINSFEGTKVLENKNINLKYHDYAFDLVLLEKTSTVRKPQE